ncbi:MAG TPA: GGDEF domain-containing protein [Clostridiales bacterium]|nr:GGDEF domain-containing protein [Clostridiales bacterium]
MPQKLYAEIIAFCVLVLLLILFSLKRNMTILLGEKIFIALIVAHIALLVVDALATLPLGTAAPYFRPMLIAANTVYFFLIGIVVFLWLVYTDYRLSTETSGLKKRLPLYAVICTAICLLSVANIFTGWIFKINERNQFVFGIVYFPLMLLIWLSAIIPTLLLALQRAARASLTILRRDYLIDAFYILPPFVGWILQTLFGLFPLVWIMTVCTLLLHFHELQGRQSSIDALTGVNNRRAFNRYIESFIDNPGRKSSLALFIIDINNFKEINDTYGHTAGDDALITFAKILRKVCGRRNCILARYGGDEFAIICTDATDAQLDALAADIEREVEIENANSNRPYKLSCSIGRAVRTGFDAEQIESIINDADRNMYKKKKEYKNSKK